MERVQEATMVLALYAEPYAATRPVVCFDERPCVLHDEVRDPLPMRPGSELRQDHEYRRGGTCCVLAAFEPLAAWRRVWVLPQRRRIDFAHVVRELCERVYPEAERIRLVCDQLNNLSRMAGRTGRARSTRRLRLPRRGAWPRRWSLCTRRFTDRGSMQSR